MLAVAKTNAVSNDTFKGAAKAGAFKLVCSEAYRHKTLEPV